MNRHDLKLFIGGFFIVALGLYAGCGDSEVQHTNNNQAAPNDGGDAELDAIGHSDADDEPDGSETPDAEEEPDCEEGDLSRCEPQPNAHAASCVEDECVYECDQGYSDDDGDLGEVDGNGCEGGCVESNEVCDGVDNDCDGEVDEGCPCDDGDTFDCYTGPADTESVGACALGIQRCEDGVMSECQDEVLPTSEVCDGEDNNCDGSVDEGVKDTFYADADGDGFGDPDDTTEACTAPDGYVDNSDDCDDTDADVHPDATEVCNEIDDNCDGSVDEGVEDTFYADADGDGFGDPNDTTQACSAPGGYVANSDDCDDSDDGINPDASETCNGVDDDCDGDVDEGIGDTYYADDDADGYGDANDTTQACSAPSGYVANSDDCNDNNAAINPGADEVCNGTDDDCDSYVDEDVETRYYYDSDDDGYGVSNNYQDRCSQSGLYRATQDGDCDDSDASVYPGAPEVCDGQDNDCDGDVDEGVTDTFYRDSDGDGYGDPSTTTEACSAPSGYVSDDTDCDDTDDMVNPGAPEVCFNSTDNDCDGQVACADSDCDGATCDDGGQLGTCSNGHCLTPSSCSSDADCAIDEHCQSCSGGNVCCPDNQLCLCEAK